MYAQRRITKENGTPRSRHAVILELEALTLTQTLPGSSRV